MERLLGGVDYFHVVNDRRMRAAGLAGNHCVFVVELDGRVDARHLERRIAAAVGAVPELAWRLVEPLGRLPRWRDGARADTRVDVIESPALLPAAERLLAKRVDGERPWAFDVVRMPERDAVMLRWFHPLTDAKGAERMVRWIGSGSGDAPDAPPPAAERCASAERPIAKLDRDARVSLTRSYLRHGMDLGRRPILSLAKASGVTRGLATRFVRVALSDDETRAFDAKVREKARLAETSVMLLAAAKIVDRALVARGFAPSQHLVPVPLSLDPKASSARMIGNNLTMMMLALDRDDLADDARAIARLGDQQRAIVRQRLDVGMIASLDYARWMPDVAYRAMATRPFHGETGSLVFSNPGAVAIESFAGVRVRDAYPLPAVVMPPGLQFIFSRFAGRLAGLVVYVDPVVSPAEAAGMGEALRAELLA